MFEDVKLNYVLVLGYGWTGSSAVVDLLKEVEGYYQPDVEFRLIKDPHGLMDLRYNIVERWDALNSDFAIRDFKEFVEYLNKVPNYFSNVGLAYKRYFGNNFINCTNDYLDSIVDFSYSSYWWQILNLYSPLKLFGERLLRKLHFRDFYDNLKMDFSKCSSKEFDDKTKFYINSLFMPIAKRMNVNNIVLDQALPAQYVSKSNYFFKDPKIIIVDRDPRDIYIDLIQSKGLIGNELGKRHNPSLYIKWHKALRENQNEVRMNNKNVMFISFENLVYDYTQSVNQILNFLDIDSQKHIFLKQYFNPLNSEKNIGLWKNYKNKFEIDEIYNELKSDCIQN